MVYSIDSKESFSNINFWLKDIKNQSSPDVKIFLIGNKADLEVSREVTEQMGEQMKTEQNFDLFMETSAKTGFNAEKVFIEAAKVLYQDYLSYKERYSRTGSMLSIPLSFQETNKEVVLPKPNIKKEDKHKDGGCC